MPHLAAERALQEKMMNRLRSLIAKRAALWVRQVASREAVGRPAPIEVGKPVEEAHPRWCPTLPGKFPSLASGGSLKSGEVCGLGGVFAVRGPLPANAVWSVGEGGFGEHVPEAQVFSDLRDANRAMDVRGPLVCMKAVRYGSGLATPFGDVSKKEGRDLADCTPVDPSVLPE